MGPTDNQTKIDSLPAYGDYVYSNPEFSWQKPVAPTAIEFGTKELGQENKVFTVDCNTGNLYRFTLNSDRTGFILNSSDLADLVLNIDDSPDEIILGTGFGCSTDIERGPDGFLYILSLSQGVIYRIIPAASGETPVIESQQDKFPIEYVALGMAAIAAAATIIVLRKRRKD
jgi:hypothetical protein